MQALPAIDTGSALLMPPTPLKRPGPRAVAKAVKTERSSFREPRPAPSHSTTFEISPWQRARGKLLAVPAANTSR